jgi:DNA-directed RNA polymerase specialized sigma24 family protein
MNEDQYEALLPFVTEVARATYRRYGVEIADVSQELWLLSLTRNLHRYLNDEDEEKGKAQLRTALHNHAKRFANEQKAQAEGFLYSDIHWYSAATIRDILPSVWDYDEWQGGASGDGIRSTLPANEGGNRMAMLADVKGAVDKLDQQALDILYSRYVLSMSWENIGEAVGLTPDMARKKDSRIVKRILESLGGERPPHEGPGSRRVMPNATAQAITGEGVE